MTKTFKVAGTLRVPSARGYRPRQLTGDTPRHSLRGGRRTDHEYMVPGACYFMCLTLLAGCGLEGPIPSGPKRDVATPAPAPAQQAASEKPAGSAPSPAKSTAETKPGRVREKAAVGAGERGRGYGGDPITAAIKARWSAEERIVFDRIRHDLDLYKAGKGQFPKDYQEFNKEILIPGNLKLPPLPEGDSYSYDPIGGELMVEHSK